MSVNGIPNIPPAQGAEWGAGLGALLVAFLTWLGVKRRRSSNGNGGPGRHPTREECALRHGGVDTRFDSLEGKVESLREDLSALSGRVLPTMESLPTVIAAATREEIAKGIAALERTLRNRGR